MKNLPLKINSKSKSKCRSYQSTMT